MIADVPFEVDGTAYALAFRMPAMKAYQRQTGESVVAGFQAAEADPGDMVRWSALFRAACTPEVSEDEADALMDALGLAEALRLLGEAAKAAFEGLTGPKAKAPAKK